jgi:hypothetical protein
VRPNQQPVCKCRSHPSGIHNASSSMYTPTLQTLQALTKYSQWNVAFGTPPPSASSQTSPPLRPGPPGNNFDMRAPQESPQTNYHLPTASPQSSVMQGAPSQLPPSSGYPSTNPSYVTPSMWQEVVASSFSDGLKRRWDHGNTSMQDQQMYKRAR